MDINELTNGRKAWPKEVSLPEVVHGLIVSKIMKILAECGYECSVMADLNGGSGEGHQFDFLGRKAGERLTITGFEMNDLIADELEMVKLRVKTLDSNPTSTMVVFQSKYPGKLNSYAEEYGLYNIDYSLSDSL